MFAVRKECLGDWHVDSVLRSIPKELVRKQDIEARYIIPLQQLPENERCDLISKFKPLSITQVFNLLSVMQVFILHFFNNRKLVPHRLW